MHVLWPQYFMALMNILPHDWMVMLLMTLFISLSFPFKTVQQEV